MVSKSGGAWRAFLARPLNLFLVAYLAVQITLPIRQFVRDEFDTARNFTWNMFAVHWSCVGHYRLKSPGQPPHRFDYLRAFHQPWGAGKITYRDRLPRFHEWMCRTTAEAGALERLEGRIACSVNDGPMIELVEPGVDLCTAEDYGVKRE